MKSAHQKHLDAVLVPGFGGTVRQPLLVRLGKQLRTAGFEVKPLALKRGAPKPGLEAEMLQLQRHLTLRTTGRSVWLGRSFGGRVCARLAVSQPPLALVLLGFPVRPAGKRRPLDEAALTALRCPTLLLQGSRDPLAPLPVLRRLVRANSRLTLETIDGATHAYGRHENRVIERAVSWLEETLEER